jgi:hypothetical protein
MAYHVGQKLQHRFSMRVYKIKAINGLTLELRNKEEKLTRFVPESMAGRMFTDSLYPSSPMPPKDIAKEIEEDLKNQLSKENVKEKKMAKKTNEAEETKKTKKTVTEEPAKKAKKTAEPVERETKYEYPAGMEDPKEKQKFRAQERARIKREEKEAAEAAAAKAERAAKKAKK